MNAGMNVFIMTERNKIQRNGYCNLSNCECEETAFSTLYNYPHLDEIHHRLDYCHQENIHRTGQKFQVKCIQSLRNSVYQ